MMKTGTDKAAPRAMWPAMIGAAALSLVLAVAGLETLAQADTEAGAPLPAIAGQDTGAALQAVAAGDSQMPRVFVPDLPRRLGQVESVERKQLFLAVMLPHILRANEQIAADRQRLIALRDRLNSDGGLEAGDRAWLDALGREYGLPRADITALLQRVNIVPPSLALAQAALESGWGTSRVAQEGNALFGQWTDASAFGLAAAGKQSGYRLKFFAHLSDAVYNYVRNLNTHPAYAGFRAARAKWLTRNATMSGTALAGSLLDYSERGQAYVQDVRLLISRNRLDRLDRATLAPEMANP